MRFYIHLVSYGTAALAFRTPYVSQHHRARSVQLPRTTSAVSGHNHSEDYAEPSKISVPNGGEIARNGHLPVENEKGDVQASRDLVNAGFDRPSVLSAVKDDGSGRLPPKLEEEGSQIPRDLVSAGFEILPPSSGVVSDGIPSSSSSSSAGIGRTESRTKISKPIPANAVPAPATDDRGENMIIKSVSAPLLAQGTAIVAETLVNTEAAYAVLSPLHRWTLSQRRVAKAVEEQERATATKKANRAAAEASAKFLSQISPPLVAPLTDAYAALEAAVEAPGKLLASVRQTGQQVAEVPARVKKLADDIVETPARVKGFAEDLVETTNNVVEGVAAIPETVAELGRKTERAIAAGAETYESLREVARALPGESRRLADSAAAEWNMASEALEELPNT